MDLTLSPAEETFRDEFRAWLEANHPGREPAGDEAAFEFRRAWQRKLNDAGWAGVSWPKEYGGRGATLVEQAIFNEEMVRARTPSVANVLALAMGGPTVIAHGTEEQRKRFLPPILSADEIWCQGFSEPGAGSDLAALKTRAVRDGDEWVVTGQKVWTTFAHHAKWCMLVARTDPEAPKHKGLTYFLMDMEQDAVQVRPLRQITGESEFNELFIEEARIPNENIVGGEGEGWGVAITTLMHERATLAFGLQIAVQIALRELLDTARETRGANGHVASEDPVIRQELAQLLIESEVLRLNAYRGLSAIMRTGRARTRGLARQVALVGGQPVADRDRDADRRPAGDAGRGPLDLPVPAGARELDRGRDDRDPQEHRGRAGARAAADALMNFGFTDDQQAIKRTAREFLEARYPLATVRRLAEDDRGFTNEQWAELVELGWSGVIVPEDRGGLGLGAVELIVIAEEMGYALAPSPWFSTTCAALLLEAAGTDEQRDRWLGAAGGRRGAGDAGGVGSEFGVGSRSLRGRAGGGRDPVVREDRGARRGVG